MRWSDEMVDAATRMWGNGYSATEIAEVIGRGLTRNAVIGKMHRLQAPKHQDKRHPFVSEDAVKAKAGKRKAERPRVCEVVAPPTAEEAVEPFERLPEPAGLVDIAWPEGVGLLDATMMHCRAVQDERGADGLAVFCGHPVHVRPDGSHSSWCVHHLRRFVDPAFLDQALTGRPVRAARRAA